MTIVLKKVPYDDQKDECNQEKKRKKKKKQTTDNFDLEI